MRRIVVAGLLALAAAAVGCAADDSLDKSAKKTSTGFGELLKGMGQELKRTGVVGSPNKDDEKARKQPETKGEEERKSP